MLNSVQLSPELNSNFAICNIYPNREPKDFSEKKNKTNSEQSSCYQVFFTIQLQRYRRREQKPKGGQKFQPCFQTTLENY